MYRFSKRKKLIFAVIALIAVLGIGIHRIFPKFSTYFELKETEQKNKETIEIVQEQEPSSAYLEVPFICQAPLQTEENWVYHEESCEEAAVLQSYLYKAGKTMTKQEAHEEILKMVDWQEKNFGGHGDIYADKVKEFIHGYYQIPLGSIEITYDAGLEDIKKYISEGHPVIVPIMGNILNNPYYPHPGYHMLVVTGYTENRIITNDNGTRHGEDFSYDNQVFLDAMNAAGGDIVVIKSIR